MSSATHCCALDGPDRDIVHIRFPNTACQPLSGCEAGTIIYVFSELDVMIVSRTAINSDPLTGALDLPLHVQVITLSVT